jgi:hypothetical protein
LDSFFRYSTVVIPVWTNYDGITKTWFQSGKDARFPSCGKINLSPAELKSVSEALKVDQGYESEHKSPNSSSTSGPLSGLCSVCTSTSSGTVRDTRMED